VRAVVEHDEFLIRSLVELRGIELHDDGEATWWLSGMADALFNGVLRTAVDPDRADRLVDDLLGRFREAGVPATWRVAPGSSPVDLPDRLAARGLPRTTLPGMVLDLQRLGNVLPPDAIRVRVAREAADVDAWMAANMAGFGIEADAADRYRRSPEAVVAGDIPGWCATAWIGDQPAATVMVCTGTGVAGVSNVTTVPARRRRGAAAAVTRHALAIARDRGYRFAVLTSTFEGRPLYEALGFEPVCEVDLFDVRP
jgi:GNAT superfamily N-acetyltransferase